MLQRLIKALNNNAALLLTLTTLSWAGNMTIGRWIAGKVPPVTLAYLRWTGATLLILPLAWPHLKREWPIIRAHAFPLIVLGITGTGLFNTLQYLALVHTTATIAGIIYSSGPIMIVVMSYFLNGEKISPLQAAGIATSLLGVLTVITRGAPQTIANLDINFGDVVMLAAVAIWAFYTAYLTRRPKMHPLTFAAFTFAVASIVNLPLSGIELASGANFELTWHTIPAIAYTAIFPSFLAYLFYNRGVELIGPTRAGAYLHLVPLFAAALAMTLLGERPGLYHLAGFALIFVGVALVTRGQ